MANIKAAGAWRGHSGPLGRSATEMMRRCRSFAGRPDRIQRRPAGLAFPYCLASERLPELDLARSFTICESSHRIHNPFTGEKPGWASLRARAKHRAIPPISARTGVMDGGAIAHALLDALSSDGSIYIVNLPYVRPETRKQ
jgi:hypothetical protein